MIAKMAESSKVRGSNFTSAELNQLCASWSHVSQNPIVGSGQKLTAFWDRTLRHYNTHKPIDRETRNIQSLDTKWSDIKRDVAKFSGCYQAVVDANYSGDNDEDTTRKSKELYVIKDLKGKDFTFLEQWHLLKDNPRFAMTIADMNQKSAQKKAQKQKGKGRIAPGKENDCPNVDNFIDIVGDEGSAGNGPVRSESLHFGEQRPMGNKIAKKLRADKSSTKIMAAAQRDMAAISAKRLKLAEKQDRESLLTIQVDDIDEECQAYFRLYRAKELRIAMLKLQREEEESLKALNGATRTPLPTVRPSEATVHVTANADSTGLLENDIEHGHSSDEILQSDDRVDSWD